MQKNGKYKKFPAHRGDWRFWHLLVPKKLQQLHAEGYRILFITNQAGIAKRKTKASDIYGKVQDIAHKLKIPITTLISAAKDKWRKPNTLMWDYFDSGLNGGITSKTDSYYVGDAAGRPKDWYPKASRDFSCSDRKFAKNLGLPFHTPETFFLKKRECTTWEWRSLDPVKFLAAQEKKPQFTDEKGGPVTPNFKPSFREIVVMMGYPGGGKSTFCKKHFPSYHWVNQDELKSKAKVMKALKEALGSGKSVILDKTHPNISTRAEYFKILTKYPGVKARCIWMQTEKEEAMHMNVFREKLGIVKRVPDMVLHMFAKKLEPPTKSEGFYEILKVNWKADFKMKAHEVLFKQFV